jgi:hypothetical protein
MKQRIFSHFQDYLIQYISHQYQDLLYCNSSQYILSTYNSQHNDQGRIQDLWLGGAWVGEGSGDLLMSHSGSYAELW